MIYVIQDRTVNKVTIFKLIVVIVSLDVLDQGLLVIEISGDYGTKNYSKLVELDLDDLIDQIRMAEI